MALVDCSNCGDRILPGVAVCPRCGHPTDQSVEHVEGPTSSRSADSETPRETVAAAAPTHEEPATGFPTWLLFVLVFVGGSVVLVAGVVAAAIVVGSMVGEFEVLGQTDDSSAVATTSTTVLVGGSDGLQVGQCLDNDELDKYLAGDEFSLVSCDDPHDTEAYLRYEFAAGPYPGDETITEELKDVCRDAFEGYVGAGFESSALNFWALWPTQGAWESGNRLG
ncbi:MAG: septum formation family protein, partial [Actinomycetota bacterium]|nr:septum formation family protein [Actinomycetota bacterium]